MAEEGFPTPVAEVIATLAEIFRHQRRTEVVELLESAHAWFENTGFDNWNGGTYTWTLRLEIPISLFASIEPRLPKIEKEISEKLPYFCRSFENDNLSDTTVSPIVRGSTVVGQRIAPSEIEVRRLWPDRKFRLFLSHVSKYKAAVSKLRDALELRGVAGFVAHEAVKPSLEWQREIELALHSMHALAALVTPDFHESSWTDQEVGWSFGRGVLVIPICLGMDPLGFAGKVQGIVGSLEKPDILANSIVETLLTNPQTHGEMRRAMVAAFCESTSFSMSLTLRDFIVAATDLTEEEKAALRTACEENDQVAGAFGVASAIYKTFGKPIKSKKAQNSDVPF